MTILLLALLGGCSFPFGKDKNQYCQGKNIPFPNPQDIKSLTLGEQAIAESGVVAQGSTVGYAFQAEVGQKLNYETNSNICIRIYNPNRQLVDGDPFLKEDRYMLQVYVPKGKTTFDLKMNLSISSSSHFQTQAEPQQLVYNIKSLPQLKSSDRLNVIVTQLVNLAAKQGKPTDALSITLIDVNSGEVAGYQPQRLRYPASIVKLFWMVAIYAQLEAGIWQSETEFASDLNQMIYQSDNQGASRILDQITGATSGSRLTGDEYEIWLDKRQQINRFFQAAGYQGININQKTFPIPYLKDYGERPTGRDAQIRGNTEPPIRNKISTEQAARLMYEIVQGEAVSQEYSNLMKQKLTRDLRREVWEKIDINQEFNPILGFLGESLSAPSLLTNIEFLSKAGWTKNTRQEVAYIASKDGSFAYILAVFAEDKSYAEDFQIFPQFSRLVYERMKNSSF
ncbi:MAG: serine hydrolase [Symploca sp. SIO1A3]|nr:serine hydrolase [Symploca sp. SIO1A3]